MKQHKRIQSLLLAIVVVFSLFPPITARAAAVAAGDCGASGDNLTWTLEEDGTLTISGTGAMRHYSYDYYWGTPWSDSDSAPWYALRSAISAVIVGENVTSIGDGAFYQCRALTSVELPDDLSSIGEHAFDTCDRLANLSLPSALTAIGDSAFANCGSLSSLAVPGSVMTFGSNAFSNCYHLESVIIADGVETLGAGMFAKCAALTSVSLPESVTSIAGSAFANCNSLQNVTLPNGVTAIEESAFANCGNLQFVVLPESLAYIGAVAFSSCRQLTEVTIPSGVTSIGDFAFYNCDNLTSIRIPEGVTRLGDSAFYDCNNLGSVEILGTVERIGNSSFANCVRLSSLSIFGVATEIGSNAFANCGRLSGLVIPEGVQRIGAYAFSNCGSLASVAIPESLTNVEPNAFSACNNLTRVSYGGSDEQWPEIVIASGNEPLQNAAVRYARGFTGVRNDYYYENGNLTPDKGMIAFGDKLYYVTDTGEIYRGILTLTAEKANGLLEPGPDYYFTEDGSLASGMIDGKFYENGKLAKGKGVVEFEGKIYYIMTNGEPYRGSKTVDETKANGILEPASGYYFTEDGSLITTGVVDGKYYEDGRLARGKGVVEFEGKIYYIMSNATFYHGSKTVDVTKANGILEPGPGYYFTEDGSLITTGIVDGKYYENGQFTKDRGVVEIEGSLYFVKPNGTIFTDGTLEISEEKTNGLIAPGSYSFGADGVLELASV